MRRFFSAFVHGLWPAGTLSKISVVWSAWSIINLARHAFGVGLGPTFRVMLEYYERAAGIVLSPLETAVRPVLTVVASMFSMPLHLQPHWKHLFVLLGLYLFRSAAVAWNTGRRASGAFRFFVALSVATISSALAGAVQESEHNRLGLFLVATIPVLGVLTYNVANAIGDGIRLQRVPGRWYHGTVLSSGPRNSARANDGNKVRAVALSVMDHLAPILTKHGVAIALVGAVAAFLPRDFLPSSGVVVLGFLMLLLIVLNLERGARFANAIRQPSETWVSAFRRTDSAQLGLSMLSVVLWALVFLAGNAGLGLVGL